MEDPNDQKQAPTLPLMEKSSDQKKMTLRKSTVSAHIDPLTVLTQLLSTLV
jgi:hypothetical protein